MGKRCFKCGRVLPIDQFYRHSGMADGRVGKCKECTCRDVRENRRRRREQYAAYEHERARRPERRAARARYGRKHAERYPERYTARNRVGAAVRDGRLAKQPCSICGASDAQAHHSDYNRPLDVTWLCFKCHREVAHGQVTTPREAP